MKTLDEVEKELEEKRKWKNIDPYSYLIELTDYIKENYKLINNESTNKETCGCRNNPKVSE